MQVVEHAKIADSQFPFGQLIWTQPLSVPTFLGCLAWELGFNYVDDLLLIELPQ